MASSEVCEICVNDVYIPGSGRRNKRFKVAATHCAECGVRCCIQCFIRYNETAEWTHLPGKCVKCGAAFPASIVAGKIWRSNPAGLVAAVSARIARNVAAREKCESARAWTVSEANLYRYLVRGNMTLIKCIAECAIFLSDETLAQTAPRRDYAPRAVPDLVGIAATSPRIEAVAREIVAKYATVSEWHTALSHPSLFQTKYTSRPATAGRIRAEVVGCPVSGCIGKALATPGAKRVKCPECAAYVCVDCRECTTENEVHVCSEASLASIAEIRENTRRCPTCAAPIFRTEGCADMFCVECKTCFSWATGEVQKSNTNPLFQTWKIAAGNRDRTDVVSISSEYVQDTIFGIPSRGEEAMRACIALESEAVRPRDGFPHCFCLHLKSEVLRTFVDMATDAAQALARAADYTEAARVARVARLGSDSADALHRIAATEIFVDVVLAEYIAFVERLTVFLATDPEVSEVYEFIRIETGELNTEMRFAKAVFSEVGMAFVRSFSENYLVIESLVLSPSEYTRNPAAPRIGPMFGSGYARKARGDPGVEIRANGVRGFLRNLLCFRGFAPGIPSVLTSRLVAATPHLPRI